MGTSGLHVDLKNSYNLKIESCFIQWEILGLQAQEATSQVALRNCSEEVGDGVRLYRSLQQRGADNLNIKDYC